MIREKIAVIDMDSVCFSIFNGNKVVDSDGKPIKVLSEAGNMVFQYIEKTEQELEESADNIIQDIMRKGEFTHYIGFVKGTKTVDYKRAILSEYKSNRSKESPKFWNFVKSYLIEKHGIYEANGAEVDDYVNVTRLNLPNSHICAIDSDLLSLEGEHYNWRKNTWITSTKEEAHYKLWSSVITGTHNNTKGIPGKGIKFIEKRFQADPIEPGEVLSCFIEHFGEYEGIKQFYQNYICCKTLEFINGFNINNYKLREIW
jgi:hypothetical protein